MYQFELDTVTSYAFRALDGSNYDVRCDVSKLLGHLMAQALNPPKHAQSECYDSENEVKIKIHVFFISLEKEQ